MILKILIVITVGLAACAPCLSDPDQSSPPGYSSPVFSGHDDAGRLMIKESGLVWRRHVAVYSTDKALEADAHKLVEMNESVNLVPVPEAHFLIRLVPQKDGRIAVSTQFNGARSREVMVETKNGLHEEQAENAFLDIVEAAMDGASARK